MSELRQNIATKEWVIIAPERLKGKPLQSELNPLMESHPAYDHHCPFCPANEGRYENIELDAVAHPDPDNEAGSPWLARCVENKYKVFSEDPESPHEPVEFEKHGIYRRLKGRGNHELVIESPIHNKTFATMTVEEIEAALRLYLARFRAHDDSGNLITVIFKNHGRRSGAPQIHPHSQIVSARVVPNYIRFLLEEARRDFDANGICVSCRMIRYELECGERLVYQNDRFLSFVPYAASVPYEVVLFPRAHAAHFGGMDDADLRDLADCLRVTMRKLYLTLSNPDYNIVFKNSPYTLGRVPFYHWHIQIAPALRSPGGFELGARVNVNVVTPEESARELAVLASLAVNGE